MVKPSVGDRERSGRGTLIDFNNIDIPQDEDILEDEAYLFIDEDNEMVECLLNLPELEGEDNGMMECLLLPQSQKIAG